MRVSKMTVYRLLHSGEMPGVRVGRSFRVPQDALDHYLATSLPDRGDACRRGPQELLSPSSSSDRADVPLGRASRGAPKIA